MNISILCSDSNHPVNNWLLRWAKQNQKAHNILIVHNKYDLSGGDILFLVSCTEVLLPQDRSAYKTCLLMHASDLPIGRGWSPHIWQIINGANEITVSMLEVEDEIDSGDLWHKIKVQIPENALWDEINNLLFSTETQLMDYAIQQYNNVAPAPQSNTNKTYFRRRTPEDSQINPQNSISNQFNLIRVCDPVRFPAYFEIHGCRYKLILEKINDPPDNN